MRNQFNVLINSEKLANAAAFLQKEGLSPSSRNGLVNQCVGYLAALAEQAGCKVASDEFSGISFLIENGLAGEAGKAKVQRFALEKQQETREFQADVRKVVELTKLSRRVSRSSYEPPPFTEQDVLNCAAQSASRGETLEEFHEFAIAAFGSEALSEALREKLAKVFKKS